MSLDAFYDGGRPMSSRDGEKTGIQAVLDRIDSVRNLVGAFVLAGLGFAAVRVGGQAADVVGAVLLVVSGVYLGRRLMRLLIWMAQYLLSRSR